MPYAITCVDNPGPPYGPWWNEDEAYRYAGMLDVDPRCDDTRHEVTWVEGFREPITTEEMATMIAKRHKEGQPDPGPPPF